MLFRLSLSVIFSISISVLCIGQDKIDLKNPSFEDVPRAGNIQQPVPIKSWSDCARSSFPLETPPDIHPGNFFSVSKLPSDGDTYLGLVVRENDSYESISQRLNGTLEAGKCYRFSIDLAKADTYVSKMDEDNIPSRDSKRMNKPTVLRIWGGSGICNTQELLAESETVSNDDWRTYNFSFSPEKSHRYLVLEAFYKTPTLWSYNGHILIDNASDITVKPCDQDEIIAAVEVPKAKPAVEKPKKDKPKTETAIVTKPKKDDAPIVYTKPKVQQPKKSEPEPTKLLTQLDRNKIRRGQKIKIENLFFEADSANVQMNSYEVLDEIFVFLNDNKDIVVEIGGHTNGNPGIPHKYCDNLSSKRAKEVASYLIRKGISPKRLEYKGYGKRKPIATNRTKQGRSKNQRVEIKILHMDT